MKSKSLKVLNMLMLWFVITASVTVIVHACTISETASIVIGIIAGTIGSLIFINNE